MPGMWQFTFDARFAEKIEKELREKGVRFRALPIGSGRGSTHSVYVSPNRVSFVRGIIENHTADYSEGRESEVPGDLP